MDRQIIALEQKDSQELIELFVRCFIDDHYYAHSMPNPATREQELRQMIAPVIAFCMQDGLCCGIRQQGRLSAFILCFDYYRTQAQQPAQFAEIFGGKYGKGGLELPMQKQLHDRIQFLGSNVLYLLSIAVDPSLRRQGLASILVDYIMALHPLDYLVSDVSSPQSLPLYRRRGFLVEEMEPDYHYICHTPSWEAIGRLFQQELLSVAIPDEKLLEQARIVPHSSCQHLLEGYRVASDGAFPYLRKTPGQHCNIPVVRLTHPQLLELQRFLNLSTFCEDFVETPSGGLLVYHAQTPPTEQPLYNDTLVEMVAASPREWTLVPDTQILLPVGYSDLSLLEQQSEGQYDRSIAYLLKCLDYRTHFESGLPRGVMAHRSHSFKDRIRRFYLGQLQVKITQELSVDCYDRLGDQIGQPAWVDLIVSVDVESSCGVVTLVSSSTPFLISHLMDNVVRNQLYVKDGKVWENLYTLLEQKLGLSKMGTPKLLLTIPKAKEDIPIGHLGSLLYAETIYDSGEQFGLLNDQELMDKVTSPTGMGQYARAFMVADSSTVIHLVPGLRAPLWERLCEVSIPVFFVELLLFEEASISIADSAITTLLSDSPKVSVMRFLRKTRRVFEDYSRTIEFWNIQMNYPSSNKSMQTLRSAFGLDSCLERMNRNLEQLQRVFDTKKDIMDRIEATMLNYIMLFLTLVQGASILYPDLLDIGRIAPLGQPSMFIGLVVLMLLYNVIRRLSSSRR